LNTQIEEEGSPDNVIEVNKLVEESSLEETVAGTDIPLEEFQAEADNPARLQEFDVKDDNSPIASTEVDDSKVESAGSGSTSTVISEDSMLSKSSETSLDGKALSCGDQVFEVFSTNDHIPVDQELTETIVDDVSVNTKDPILQVDGGLDVDDKNIELESEDFNEVPILLKTVSIHLRNVAPVISKSDLVSIFSKYDGYLRIALSDPLVDNGCLRKAWVTFLETTNVKEICCALVGKKLAGTELDPVINRELSKKVRYVDGKFNDRKVLKSHLLLASKIIEKMDIKWSLHGESGGLKLMKNITDYLVDEANAEEEELLGINQNIRDNERYIQEDQELCKVLDKLILYLRIVHSIDFYNHSEYPYEDFMPNRLGLLHARGPVPKDKVTTDDIDKIIEEFERKIAGFVDKKGDLSDEEIKVLGSRDEEEEIEKFISTNAQELAADKWLCPLSGKKFKGLEYVRKHIMSKFSASIETVRMEAQYFNNYLRDRKRPEPSVRHSNYNKQRENSKRFSGSSSHRSYERESSRSSGYSRPRNVWSNRHRNRNWNDLPYRRNENETIIDSKPNFEYRDVDRPLIDYSDVDPMNW